MELAHHSLFSRENCVRLIFFCCGFLSIAVTIGIVCVLSFEAIRFFQQVSLFEFLFTTTWTPLFVEKHFGVLPLLSGTLLISGIAILIATPCSIVIAIFLNEYASSALRRTLKPILELLAGIPTVVYGYFALLWMTPLLQYYISDLAGFNALSPGIVMGMMILPFMVSLIDDALHAVPHGLRAAAYGLGSTRLQVVTRVVLPSASSGIIASFILAVSRAIGETMLVSIAAGMLPTLTANPLVPVQTITAFIVQVSLGDTPTGTLEYSSIFAVASVLFVLTFVLNVIAQYVRSTFRPLYA